MSRRGGVLLEVMLALALFVAAGSLVLSIFADGSRAVARAESLGHAVDAARSILAEVEAGIRSVGDLRGSIDDLPPPWTELRIEASSQRSDLPGLVEVEVRVFDRERADSPRFTLRQLLPVATRRGEGEGDGAAEGASGSDASAGAAEAAGSRP